VPLHCLSTFFPAFTLPPPRICLPVRPSAHNTGLYAFLPQTWHAPSITAVTHCLLQALAAALTTCKHGKPTTRQRRCLPVSAPFAFRLIALYAARATRCAAAVYAAPLYACGSTTRGLLPLCSNAHLRALPRLPLASYFLRSTRRSFSGAPAAYRLCARRRKQCCAYAQRMFCCLLTGLSQFCYIHFILISCILLISSVHHILWFLPAFIYPSPGSLHTPLFSFHHMLLGTPVNKTSYDALAAAATLCTHPVRATLALALRILA